MYIDPNTQKINDKNKGRGEPVGIDGTYTTHDKLSSELVCDEYKMRFICTLDACCFYVCVRTCDDEAFYCVRVCVAKQKGDLCVHDNDMQIQHPTGYQEDLVRMSSNCIIIWTTRLCFCFNLFTRNLLFMNVCV